MPFGIQPLYSGRELIIFLGYLFIFLSGMEILHSENLKKLILTIFLASLIQALYGLRQYFIGLENLQELVRSSELAQMEQISLKRIFGFTFSPDFFSGIISASIILLIGSAKKIILETQEREKSYSLILIILILLLLLPMLLSKSLGGFLAFFTGIISLILLRISRVQLRKSHIFLIMGLLIIGSVIFSMFIYHRRSIMFQRRNNPVVLRLYNFQAGLRVYEEKPFFGVGLGNFWIAYPKYRQPQSNEVRYAHNNFIQILAEAGLIAESGLMLLMLYLFLGFLKIRKRDDAYLDGIFCALIAMACHWLWDFGLYAPELASIFWVLLAGFTVITNNGSPKKISRLTLVSLGILLLLLLAISSWMFAEQRMIKKAEAYFQKRQPDQAEAYALKALKILPADDYAYGLLAFCGSMKGEKEEIVISYFQKAIATNPRFAFWHKHLADYYFKQGNINSAESEYLRALSLYPNNIQILSRLAEIQRLKGDLTKAEKYARNALKVFGDQRPALWELYKIKLAKGQREEMLIPLKQLSENYLDQEAKKLIERYTKEQQ